MKSQKVYSGSGGRVGSQRGRGYCSGWRLCEGLLVKLLLTKLRNFVRKILGKEVSFGRGSNQRIEEYRFERHF